WLFYAYPLAFLLSLAAYLLYLMVYRKSFWAYIAFLALCSGIVLTRSLFHLVLWLLPVLIFVAWQAVRQNPSRKLLYIIPAIVFFLIPLGLYVKNLAQYGNFTSST